jgi:hypothetical protein
MFTKQLITPKYWNFSNVLDNIFLFYFLSWKVSKVSIVPILGRTY